MGQTQVDPGLGAHLRQWSVVDLDDERREVPTHSIQDHRHT